MCEATNDKSPNGSPSVPSSSVSSPSSALPGSPSLPPPVSILPAHSSLSPISQPNTASRQTRRCLSVTGSLVSESTANSIANAQSPYQSLSPAGFFGPSEEKMPGVEGTGDRLGRTREGFMSVRVRERTRDNGEREVRGRRRGRSLGLWGWRRRGGDRSKEDGNKGLEMGRGVIEDAEIGSLELSGDNQLSGDENSPDSHSKISEWSETDVTTSGVRRELCGQTEDQVKLDGGIKSGHVSWGEGLNRVCTNMKHNICEGTGNAFEKYAYFVFDHAVKVIIVALVVCCILSLGLFYRESEFDMLKLYAISGTHSDQVRGDLVSHSFDRHRGVYILAASDTPLLSRSVLTHMKEVYDYVMYGISVGPDEILGYVPSSSPPKPDGQVSSSLDKRSPAPTESVNGGGEELGAVGRDNSLCFQFIDEIVESGHAERNSTEGVGFVTSDADSNSHADDLTKGGTYVGCDLFSVFPYKLGLPSDNQKINNTNSFERADSSAASSGSLHPHFPRVPHADTSPVHKVALSSLGPEHSASHYIQNYNFTLSYQDLCIPSADSSCSSLSVMDLYAYPKYSLGKQISVRNWPQFVNIQSRRRLMADSVLGNVTLGATFNGGVRVINATALMLYMRTRGNEEVLPYTMQWEEKLADYVNNYKSPEGMPDISLHIFTERSMNDELQRASEIDFDIFISLLVGYCLLFGYTMLVNSSCDKYSTKTVSAGIGAVSSLLGYAAGAGLFYWMGFKHVPPADCTPFLVMGIGVDDTFVILNSYSLTYGSSKLPSTHNHSDGTKVGSSCGSCVAGRRCGRCSTGVPRSRDRIGRTMRDAGLAITITTSTNLVAFIVGATSPFMAITNFCAVTAVALLFGYFSCLTVFLATLCLEARREEQKRLLPWPICWRDSSTKGKTECELDSKPKIPAGSSASPGIPVVMLCDSRHCAGDVIEENGRETLELEQGPAHETWHVETGELCRSSLPNDDGDEEFRVDGIHAWTGVGHEGYACVSRHPTVATAMALEGHTKGPVRFSEPEESERFDQTIEGLEVSENDTRIDDDRKEHIKQDDDSGLETLSRGRSEEHGRRVSLTRPLLGSTESRDGFMSPRQKRVLDVCDREMTGLAEGVVATLSGNDETAQPADSTQLCTSKPAASVASSSWSLNVLPCEINLSLSPETAAAVVDTEHHTRSTPQSPYRVQLDSVAAPCFPMASFYKDPDAMIHVPSSPSRLHVPTGGGGGAVGATGKKQISGGRVEETSCHSGAGALPTLCHLSIFELASLHVGFHEYKLAVQKFYSVGSDREQGTRGGYCNVLRRRCCGARELTQRHRHPQQSTVSSYENTELSDEDLGYSKSASHHVDQQFPSSSPQAGLGDVTTVPAQSSWLCPAGFSPPASPSSPFALHPEFPYRFCVEPKGNVGRVFRNFVMRYYSRILSTTIGRVVILLLFTAYVAFAIYGWYAFMKTGLSYYSVVRADSRLKEFYDNREMYFDTYGEEVIVLFADEDVRWWDEDVQDEVTWMTDLMDAAEYTAVVNNGFKTFLDIHRATLIPGNATDFFITLQDWLQNDRYGQHYQSDFLLTPDNRLEAWKFSFFQKYIDHSQTAWNWFTECRKDVAGGPEGHPVTPFVRPDNPRATAGTGERLVRGDCFYYGALVLEADPLILSYTLQNMAIALAAILLIAALAIPTWCSAVVVVVVILMIDVGMFGYMFYWGVPLNLVSMVNLVMSIGFSIDHTAHVTHAFTHCVGATRLTRMKECLVVICTPVFHGALSTWLAAVCLSSSNKDILVTFFKMTTLVRHSTTA
eukprot:GHVQ01026973.1.p1 GENE.GHVQ01026973.1~~GHVQ01026973.1.p1  ORF type:complete len:1784 (+),score=218.00 GHVQ01026973.1:1457-6808(+)